MPYDARVFSILIASPGDVQAERNAIAEIIYEWNHAHSRERGIVLLPLKWETHSYPEMGKGPQDVINRQVVDNCDLAVGVFWMRLGTPTRIADSGTAEEVARAGNSGKPVMLYFSNSPVNPSSVDLNETARLREFKLKQFPQGLVEDYDSLQEFRAKFSRQLELRIQETINDDARKQAEEKGASADGGGLLVMGLYDYSLDALLPEPLVLNRITCANPGDIPDYSEPSLKGISGGSGSKLPGFAGLYQPIISTGDNKDYLRQMVSYIESNLTQFAFRFGFRAPTKTVRDIHVELRIEVEGSAFAIDSRALSGPVPSPTNAINVITTGSFGSSGIPLNSPRSTVLERPGIWNVELDIPVVQQERTVYSQTYFARAQNSGVISFEATVYSGDAKPFILKSQLTTRITETTMPYADMLKSFEIEYPD